MITRRDMLKLSAASLLAAGLVYCNEVIAHIRNIGGALPRHRNHAGRPPEGYGLNIHRWD